MATKKVDEPQVLDQSPEATDDGVQQVIEGTRERVALNSLNFEQLAEQAEAWVDSRAIEWESMTDRQSVVGSAQKEADSWREEGAKILAKFKRAMGFIEQINQADAFEFADEDIEDLVLRMREYAQSVGVKEDDQYVDQNILDRVRVRYDQIFAHANELILRILNDDQPMAVLSQENIVIAEDAKDDEWVAPKANVDLDGFSEFHDLRPESKILNESFSDFAETRVVPEAEEKEKIEKYMFNPIVEGRFSNNYNYLASVLKEATDEFNAALRNHSDPEQLYRLFLRVVKIQFELASDTDNTVKAGMIGSLDPKMVQQYADETEAQRAIFLVGYFEMLTALLKNMHEQRVFMRQPNQ